MADKKHKRPFRGTSKPRTFFDRKVRNQGDTLSLSITKIIPNSWRLVRIKPLKTTKNSVTVKITKLLDDEMIAQATAPNQTSEQYA